jgi:hypothetical protein
MISGSERGFSTCALGRHLSVMFLQLLSSFARGCYFVTVAGTFAEGGTVTLVNDAAEVLATFPEAGTTTVDLPVGVYNLFAVSNVTDLAASISTASYV